jgi:hypothetical protein
MYKYRPTPAIVVALFALVIALGDVGYASTESAQARQHLVSASVRAYGVVTPLRTGLGLAGALDDVLPQTWLGNAVLNGFFVLPGELGSAWRARSTKRCLNTSSCVD